MRRLIAVLWTISMLVPAVARAQAFPPNETGVTMGHWHLNTRDIEANKKIFVTMGGTAMKAGDGAAVSGEERLVLEASSPVEALLFDLA